MLPVLRGSSAADFHRSAFDANVLFRIDDDTGAIVARRPIHGADFRIADESPQHANHSPESLGGSTARMVLVVDEKPAPSGAGLQLDWNSRVIRNRSER